MRRSGSRPPLSRSRRRRAPPRASARLPLRISASALLRRGFSFVRRGWFHPPNALFPSFSPPPPLLPSRPPSPALPPSTATVTLTEAFYIDIGSYMHCAPFDGGKSMSVHASAVKYRPAHSIHFTSVHGSDDRVRLRRRRRRSGRGS